MKRFLACVLALAWILGCCPAISVQAGTAGVQMVVASGKTVVAPGETVDFVVDLSETLNCSSAAIVVNYDEAVLEYVENSGTCTAEGAMMRRFGMSGGKLTGTFMYAAVTPVSGRIFRFQMKVLDAAAIGSTTMTFEPSARAGSEPTTVTAEPITLNVELSQEPGGTQPPEEPDETQPPEKPGETQPPEIPDEPELPVRMTVTPSKTEVFQGDVIDFSVTMTELPNCKSGGIALIYDESVLQYVEGSGRCLVSGVMMGSFGIVGGKLGGSFAYGSAATASGEIFHFQMKALNSAALGSTTIAFEPAAKVASGEAVEVIVEAVTLNVLQSEGTETPEQPEPPEQPEEPEEPEEPEIQVQMTVTPERTDVRQGEIAEFIVSMSELEECRSGGIFLTYDTTVLEFVDGACLLNGVVMGNFGITGGLLGGSFAYGSATTASGEIFRFWMKVVDAAALGDTTISFTASARNSSGNVPATATPVTVHVLCNHSWSTWASLDAQEHVHSCVKCGTTENSAHRWDAGQVTATPNCVQVGEMTYTCEDCSAVRTEQIPATGIHTWSDWQEEQAPTCTDTGSEIRNCVNCIARESQPIPELGHDWTEQILDEAHLRTTAENCTQFNTYWYDCSRCNLVSETEYFVSTVAGPHSFTEQIRDDAHMVPDSDPTLYYYDCEHCDTMGTETYETASGDLDGNDQINEDDAIYLLQYVLMPGMFPVSQNVDYDGNGMINEDDAIYLLQYVLMPDMFPL